MEHYANAVYRDSAYPEHNPLIDALPAPLNRENLLDILALESVLPENYHSLSPQERQELCGRLKEIYLPLGYSAEIYMSFYTGLLTAYTGRTKLFETRQMMNLSKSIKYMQYTVAPDSPIQAECFSVIGEPGMGKTTTIKKILELFPPAIFHSEYRGKRFEKIQIPYIFVQCPMNSSVKAVCYQILDSIDRIVGTEYAKDAIDTKKNLDVVVTNIAQQCLRFCVGAIIIDEVQNVLRTNVKEPNAGNMMISPSAQKSLRRLSDGPMKWKTSIGPMHGKLFPVFASRLKTAALNLRCAICSAKRSNFSVGRPTRKRIIFLSMSST